MPVSSTLFTVKQYVTSNLNMHVHDIHFGSQNELMAESIKIGITIVRIATTTTNNTP